MNSARSCPACVAGLVLIISLTACTDAPTPREGATASTTSAPSAADTAPTVGVEPDPAVQAYIDAVNRQDLAALVDSFAPDGVVVDVSRRIEGRDAIRRWAEREVIGGALRVIRVAEQRPNGQRLLVHWAPSGSGGFEAYYDFTTALGVIVAADLQYA